MLRIRVAQGRQYRSKHGKVHIQLFCAEEFLRVVTGCSTPSGIRAHFKVHQLVGRDVYAVCTDRPAEISATHIAIHQNGGPISMGATDYFVRKMVQQRTVQVFFADLEQPCSRLKRAVDRGQCTFHAFWSGFHSVRESINGRQLKRSQDRRIGGKQRFYVYMAGILPGKLLIFARARLAVPFSYTKKTETNSPVRIAECAVIQR